MREGIGLIKQFEGLRLEAYLDPIGIPTIGYGETRGVKMGMKITAREADDMLAKRYDEFEAEVVPLIRVKINPNQLGALVCFAYNVGTANLKGSTLLKLLNQKASAEEVSKQFVRWNKAGGKVLKGLTRRREAEAKLFLTKWDSNPVQPDLL